MTVIFHNVQRGDPKEMDLNEIPRVGEEVTLDVGTYVVETLRWQLTSKGLREVGIDLKLLEK